MLAKAIMFALSNGMATQLNNWNALIASIVFLFFKIFVMQKCNVINCLKSNLQ